MKYNIKIIYDVPIKMRDGKILYCDIYRPDNSEKYPAIVNRTPYLKDNINPLSGYLHVHKLAARGYNVVVQDVRGSANSEGILDPAGHQVEDGYDTVEAIAAMDCCDGNVGMVGESYHGFSQLAAAYGQPPHLKAICPFQTSWTKFPAIYAYGIFSPVLYIWIYGRALDNDRYHPFLSDETKEKMQYFLEHMEEQMKCLPLKDMPAADIPQLPELKFHRDLLENITNEEYLKEIGRAEGFERVLAPCFELTGWNDFLRDETIYNYTEFAKRGGNEAVRTMGRLIIGPWQHGDVLADSLLGQYFGPEASGDAQDICGKIGDWFDYWMKGIDSSFMTGAPVRLFIMGDNKWRNEQSWPLERTKYTKLYLHSKGNANTLNGDGRLNLTIPGSEPSDRYLYDPDNPVPSMIPYMEDDKYAHIVQDQRINERRSDVLVYTSDYLKERTELTGPVEAQLFVSSTAVDTDYVCKLIDVWPDGTASCLMSRLVRMRYRNGKKPEMMIPEEIYKIVIPVGNTGIALYPGHRLRIEITSSLQPNADINLNTGGRVGYEDKGIIAIQTIFHDEAHPSCIVLPVIPNE
jgi:putative CocE/NonD family hydrolase